ncbi:MAG: hypothetical protein WCT41_00470 [Candidatus Paceibacterota bacterium]|jgi:hypothetical protein
MSEGIPNQEGMTKSEYLRLAVELSEQVEALPFFGIDEGAYQTMKKGEEEVDPDYPDTTTPIDARVARLQLHGMKIVLGKNPQSGMVYVLPGDSDDIENDGLFPRHLSLHSDMDARLKKLILANKKPSLK